MDETSAHATVRSITAAIALVLLISCLACGQADDPAVELTGVLAPLGQLDDWKALGPARTHDATTLWEYINGGADLYLSNGFTELSCVELKRPGRGGLRATVEVFELGSLLNAYGVYQPFHDPAAVVEGIGAQASYFGTMLAFYEDRYFVRVLPATGMSAGAEQRDALLALGRALAEGIPGQPAEPAELDYLAADGLPRDAIAYSPRSLLGYSFLHGGLTVPHGKGETSFSVFVALCDPAAAELALEGLAERLIPPDEGARSELPTGDRILRGTDPHHGALLVIPTVSGPLVGAHGFTDEALARRVIQDVAGRVDSAPSGP